MPSESYKRHVRGLALLGEYHGYGCAPEVKTRADYQLALNALEGLRGAVIGAGSNTWREHKERYRRALAWFNQLPTPCGATLYHVDASCDGVGYGGICTQCRQTVKNVMQRTCDKYGIQLVCV